MVISSPETVKNGPQEVLERKSYSHQEQMRGLNRKDNRHLPEWVRPVQMGSWLLCLCEHLYSFIHLFIPPSLSIYYGLDKVLDAGNTVFNNSVVHAIKFVPESEKLGRRPAPGSP